jgi:hypothetical protein
MLLSLGSALLVSRSVFFKTLGIDLEINQELGAENLDLCAVGVSQHTKASMLSEDARCINAEAWFFNVSPRLDAHLIGPPVTNHQPCAKKRRADIILLTKCWCGNRMAEWYFPDHVSDYQHRLSHTIHIHLCHKSHSLCGRIRYPCPHCFSRMQAKVYV